MQNLFSKFELKQTINIQILDILSNKMK